MPRKQVVIPANHTQLLPPANIIQTKEPRQQDNNKLNLKIEQPAADNNKHPSAITLQSFKKPEDLETSIQQRVPPSEVKEHLPPIKLAQQIEPFQSKSQQASDMKGKTENDPPISKQITKQNKIIPAPKPKANLEIKPTQQLEPQQFKNPEPQLLHNNTEKSDTSDSLESKVPPKKEHPNYQLITESKRVATHVQEIISAKTPFIDKDFPAADSSLHHSQSKLPHSKVIWRRANEIAGKGAQLFSQGIEPNDIIQGELGDCWLLSAVAGTAQYPKLIENIFITKQQNEAGIYELCLYVGGSATRVVIDDFIPCKEWGAPAFTSNHGTELWAMLLEKAYAKIHGSYSRLISGHPEDAFQDLTGMPAQGFNLEDEVNKPKMANGELFKQIQAWFKKGYFVVTSTSNVDQERTGLVPSHAYSFLDAREVLGKKLVLLRNPWGSDMWKGAWNDGDTEHWTPEAQVAVGLKKANDGQFWMEWSDYTKYFRSLGVCYIDLALRDTRLPGECIIQNNVVLMRGYDLIVDEETDFFFGVQQKDTRIANVESYESIGMLVLNANTGKAVADTLSCANRSTFTEEVILQKGSYILLPYTFAKKPVSCTLVILGKGSYQVVNEKIPFNYAKEIDLSQCFTDMAILMCTKPTPIMKGLTLYSISNRGCCSIAVASTTASNQLEFSINLVNMDLVEPKLPKKPISLPVKPGERKLVARMQCTDSTKPWQWSYSYKYFVTE